MMNLLGIAVVVAGLAARLNPVMVVTAAAVVTGLAGGLDLIAVISAIGHNFNDARYISVAFLVIPVVGLSERAGLQAQARKLVGRLRSVTVGRMLLAYLAVRQVSAALGLLSLGGQANMVRPLLAPMAEAEEEARRGPLDGKRRLLIRANAAAADNIGAFFGEDIFIALGSVLLITAILRQNHLPADPLRVALWAIPTAIVAFVVHAIRLLRLDAALGRPRKAP
ncbi:MAG TPA: DUF969 family protein [Caulobacteraceae bacterium]|jgi:uncharacterized membrane protein